MSLIWRPNAHQNSAAPSRFTFLQARLPPVGNKNERTIRTGTRDFPVEIDNNLINAALRRRLPGNHNCECPRPNPTNFGVRLGGHAARSAMIEHRPLLKSSEKSRGQDDHPAEL